MEQNQAPNSVNIYLIGFMGVGKSAVGRTLAKTLHMKFVDSDWQIEKEAGMSIAKIFEKHGEPAFRDMERRFIESGHPSTGMVVACGGGLPIQPGMRELLIERGVVICLFAQPETILKRTRDNPKRPLLNVENPRERLNELMVQREPVYMHTGIGISTEGRTISEVVENIIRVYRREVPRFRKKHIAQTQSRKSSS